MELQGYGSAGWRQEVVGCEQLRRRRLWGRILWSRGLCAGRGQSPRGRTWDTAEVLLEGGAEAVSKGLPDRQEK